MPVTVLNTPLHSSGGIRQRLDQIFNDERINITVNYIINFYVRALTLFELITQVFLA